MVINAKYTKVLIITNIFARTYCFDSTTIIMGCFKLSKETWNVVMGYLGKACGIQTEEQRHRTF